MKLGEINLLHYRATGVNQTKWILIRINTEPHHRSLKKSTVKCRKVCIKMIIETSRFYNSQKKVDTMYVGIKRDHKIFLRYQEDKAVLSKIRRWRFYPTIYNFQRTLLCPSPVALWASFSASSSSYASGNRKVGVIKNRILNKLSWSWIAAFDLSLSLCRFYNYISTLLWNLI